MSLELRFFEEPHAMAEFKYWVLQPDWSLEEIVALSLGKDPRVVSDDKFVHGTRGTEFSAAYSTRLKTVVRHHAAGELKERTRPAKVIEWAEEFDFPLPQELVELVRQLQQKRMRKRNPLAATIEASAPEHAVAAPQPLSIHHAESENIPREPGKTSDAPTEALSDQSAANEPEILDPEEQPFHPKHRKTLLILVAAMVIKSYRYKSGMDMGALTRTIEAHLDDLGVQMHRDTIRNCVRSGIKMLEGNCS